MSKSARYAWIALGSLVALVLLAIVLLPLFLNADSFRSRVEASLSHSLGRPVTMSHLTLAVWSGSLDAQNVQIADDPSFSNQPFLQADTIRIRVELLPLLTQKAVHIKGFSVIDPKVNLLRAANGKWNYSTLGNNAAKSPGTANNNALNDFTAGEILVKNGTLTVSDGSAGSQPIRYQGVNLDVKQFRIASSFPFTASAVFPSGGTLSATGEAGPLDKQDTAATPVHLQATLQSVQLATAGVLPANAGVAGLLNLKAQIQSDGRTLQATGDAQINGVKLARNASPASKPLNLQFKILKNEQQQSGQIQQMDIATGGAALNVTGTFATKGPDTDLDLQVTGNAVPVDSLEAFLPSIGVHLPEGSQLRGGTLTTALRVTGPAANPTVAGPVRLANTQLAGFDLGAKLATLSTLTGGRIGKATGSGTNIRSLTTNLQESAGNVRTDNLNIDIAGLGTATGGGTVSASSALDYRLLLKLTGLMGGAQSTAAPAKGQPAAAGLAGVASGLMSLVGGSPSSAGALGSVGRLLLSQGIPVAIGGTAGHPVFTPNLAGLTRNLGAGALRQALPGKQTPGSKTQANPLQNALGGLLGH